MGPSLIGAACFVGLKFAGYSAYGYGMTRTLSVRRPRPLVFGAARTGVGFGVGVLYGLMLTLLPEAPAHLAYVGLLPVRVLEWGLLIWLFYGRSSIGFSRLSILTFIGVLVSYLLDGLGLVFVFVVPGAMWVC